MDRVLAARPSRRHGRCSSWRRCSCRGRCRGTRRRCRTGSGTCRPTRPSHRAPLPRWTGRRRCSSSCPATCTPLEPGRPTSSTWPRPAGSAGSSCCPRRAWRPGRSDRRGSRCARWRTRCRSPAWNGPSCDRAASPPMPWPRRSPSARTGRSPHPSAASGFRSLTPRTSPRSRRPACRTTGHAGGVYELTGPEVITPRQQAEAIAAALASPVRFHELTRLVPTMHEPAGGEATTRVESCRCSVLATPRPATTPNPPSCSRQSGRQTSHHTPGTPRLRARVGRTGPLGPGVQASGRPADGPVDSAIRLIFKGAAPCRACDTGAVGAERTRAGPSTEGPAGVLARDRTVQSANHPGSSSPPPSRALRAEGRVRG